MVIFGERFDYSKVTLTEQQERVARCRAEAALRGRQQARRWAAKRRRQAKGQGAGHPARHTHARHSVRVAESPRYDHAHGQPFAYYLGEYYTGQYYDGESLVVQFVVGELHNGEFPAAHFIAGQFEDGDSQGLFLVMEQAGSAE